jgi:hypothetical protein
MLGFIKLAYTKNLRTGERNVSFDFGMSNIGGDIIWGNITSSMSSRMGLGLTSKENMDNVFNYLEEKGRTPEILVGLGNAMIKDRLNSWGWGAWNHYDDKAKNAFIDNLMNAEKMKNQITPIEVDELFSEVFHNKVESEKNRLNSPFKNDTLGAMNVVLTNFENALNAQKGIRDLASLNSINTGKARVKAEKEALRLRDLRMDATKALIDARFAFELSSGLLNDSPDKEKRK